MQKLLEAVFRLDASGDFFGLQEFIVNNRYGAGQVFIVFQQLLINKRLRSAYVLALMLDKSGQQHPSISLALCVGGLIYDKREEETRGLRMLTTQTDAQPAAQQQFMDRELIFPVMVGALNEVLPKSDPSLVLRVIAILKAAAPQFRTIFDWDAPTTELSLVKMRQRRPEQLPLVSNPLPPAGVPRLRRKVLIVIRQNRGVGVRYSAAMNSYGWQAEVCDGLQMTEDAAGDDCRFIAERCRHEQIDLLLFDARQLYACNKGMDAYRAMKVQLQQENPALKVLGTFFDSTEEMERDVLEKVIDFLDGALSYHHNPLAPHMLANPHYKKKVLHNFLVPVCDRSFGSTDRPLLPQMYFRGTISAPHWTRVLWLAAADHIGLPITKKINSFSYENPLYKQSPLDDHVAYMRDLAEATCCFSVVMCDYQLRYLIYRSFEVPLSGSLLVQEFTPLMYNYFIPGEHYLEYTTLAELASIARFITERREEAEAVRRCGHAFAREQFSDEKMIGQIDKFLYFPD
ncbi:MAG: glycosyltransferase [Magnetococcus sp. MYC-9]